MQLTLLTFPQSWENGSIALRVLVLPRGNPLEPLIPGAATFVAANLRLNALVIPSLDRLPTSLDALPGEELVLNQPAQRALLFEKLRDSFEFEPVPSPTNPRPAGTKVRKYLTESYRNAFQFVRPRRPEFAGVDNSFECALINPAIAEKPKRPAPSKQVRWGQVLSFVLRQPVLARELGLLYETSFTPPANAFDAGGWLYVELNAASDYAAEAGADPAMVARYAARIPALAAGRALFAAVQFPVHSAPPPPFDPELLVDAQEYDDGFAKIVHGTQPRTAAVLESRPAEPPSAAKRPLLSPSAPPAAKETGIRLGWDDEQIAIWLNRMLVNDPAEPLHAPVAVASYRVDVRRARSDDDWTSLNLVEGEVTLKDVVAGLFRGELGVEALPVQLEGEKTGDFWLPSYFTTWAGASLALGDLQALDFAVPAAQRPARPYTPVGLESVPLLYGRDYEFRVRLGDLSGGGPDSKRPILNPGLAPLTTVAFRRYVRPKAVRVVAEADGTYTVLRPRLGYPEIAFTGRPNFAADLVADVPGAKAEEREPGLPDPYVTTLRIEVGVRSLAGDTSEFTPVYTTTRTFPAGAEGALTLEIQFQDTPDVALFGAVADDGPIVVPSARDVRLSLTPVCDDPDLEFFGDRASTAGAVPFYISARGPSQDESQLWAPGTPASQMQMIFLQPDPAPAAMLKEQLRTTGSRAEVPSDIAGRLAQQLGLGLLGLTLVPPPGRRMVFGCSTKLPHTLAPDRSAIQFASRTDLQRIWIGAIRMRLARDWTWDALQPVSFKVIRTLDGKTEEAGTIEMPRTVNPRALDGGDRTGTDILFLDAWDGKPPAGEPIREHHVTYTLTAVFRDPQPLSSPDPAWDVRVPITTPPSQTPKLISAGIALSPYSAAEDYSSTELRRRRVWFEFDAPPLDEHDLYFARVLAYSPDPVLMRAGEIIPEPEEPPLPIDPEWITVIHPGQPADASGFDSMQVLEQARDSKIHYMLPLPKGVDEDAPELFGMWVYELRLGHDDTRWSKAQGRFGPQLRVAGIQHPAPALSCVALRRPSTIEIAAPFATPVLDDRILRTRTPLTEIWLLLYAQVQQLDRKGWRNVLLRRARAALDPDRPDLFYSDALTEHGLAQFDMDTTWSILTELGLPRGTPLSVMAVELIPGHATISYEDPVGAHLGMVRVLRASTLVPVPPVCT